MRRHVFPISFAINSNKHNLPGFGKVIINNARAAAFTAPGAALSYLAGAACSRYHIPGFRIVRQPESKVFVFRITPDSLCLFDKSGKLNNGSHTEV